MAALDFIDRDFSGSIAMLRRLKSRQLLLLVALSEARSLRKAAAALNMTQPTATKLLQDLESDVGSIAVVAACSRPSMARLSSATPALSWRI